MFYDLFRTAMDTGVMPEALQAFEDSILSVLALLQQMVNQASQAESLAAQIETSLANAAASMSAAAKSMASISASATMSSSLSSAAVSGSLGGSSAFAAGGVSIGSVSVTVDPSKFKDLDDMLNWVENFAKSQTQVPGLIQKQYAAT